MYWSASGEFGKECTALFQYFLRYVFMGSRVDHVQPVTEYGLCPERVAEAGGMCRNVNAVCQTADNIGTISRVSLLAESVFYTSFA